MSVHGNRRRLLATGAVVLSWCGSSSNDVASAFTTNTHFPRSSTLSYGSVMPSIHRLHPQRHCPSSPSYNKLTYSSIVPHRGDCNVRSTTPTTSSFFKLCMASDPIVESKFEKMNEDDDQVIAFMDTSMTRGIDCYVDSYATVDGIEYTIGSPCDYAVAICYFEGEDEQLVPIELDDPLMDDIFPIAEGIIEDEFGEELVLLRTPQTLTLVGELEENEEDEEDDDEDDEDSDMDDTEEEVEILVSFEEDGREYHLVRLLDPVLLVGKIGAENTRILLTPEESDTVMPKLEAMFMSYQEEQDGMLD